MCPDPRPAGTPPWKLLSPRPRRPSPTGSCSFYRGSDTMDITQNVLDPTPEIHRYGKRNYCVLPAGIDPQSDDAKGKHLLISSRKACEVFVLERQALAKARAAAMA